MARLGIMGALLGVGACALTLGGCATGKGLTPETARAIIQEFHQAGCGGSFNLNAGLGVGQLGGSASMNLDVNAECPVGDIPPPQVIPLSDLR